MTIPLITTPPSVADLVSIYNQLVRLINASSGGGAGTVTTAADLTPSKLPKATGATQIDDSIVSDDGATVSIGDPDTLTNLQITPRDDDAILFQLSANGSDNGYIWEMQAGATSTIKSPTRDVMAVQDLEETGPSVVILGNATAPGFSTGDNTTPLSFRVPILATQISSINSTLNIIGHPATGVAIDGGLADGVSGAGPVLITGGGNDTGASGGAGLVVIQAGWSNANGIHAANTVIRGGDAFTGNANGGNVTLIPGDKAGSGEKGVIVITDSRAIEGLPASPSVGMLATVNDALTPTVGVPVVGGGAASAVVCYGGTQWTVVSI